MNRPPIPLRLLRNEAARTLLAPLTGGRASEWIRPTVAALYITRHCNSRCTMCDFWKHEDDPNELTSEQWGVVFSRLKAFGVGFVGVNASGEMFTRRDVFEILEHLARLGLGFGVNSNGTLFTEKKAKRLAELGPRAVTIGLDGVGDAAYLETRGLKGGFTKVTGNIDNLLRAGVRNVSIGSVLMPSSIDQWVPLAEFALAKGLGGVRFTAHHDAYFSSAADHVAPPLGKAFLARAGEEIERLIELKRRTGIVKNSELYLRKTLDYYRNPRDYFPVPCLQGSNRIELDVYGNVTLCSFVDAPLGNLVRQEMEEIWNSPAHRQARADAFAGRCPKCFLSCYGEENLRLSAQGFLPTLATSLARGIQLLSHTTQGKG